MPRAAFALLTASALALALPPLAMAQATPPSSGTKNAINGINSYPGPEFVKYAREREPQDRRIDLFISDWQGSMPRFEHGSLVLRDILVRGDNFAPSQKRARSCVPPTSSPTAGWLRARRPHRSGSKVSRRFTMFSAARAK